MRTKERSKDLEDDTVDLYASRGGVIMFNDFSVIKVVVFIVLALTSVVLGLIKFGSILDTKDWSWQHKFLEVWNSVLNFFIAGCIGYYFVLVRWPKLLGGEVLSLGDFILFLLFTLGIFGHLNVLSYNLTIGIEAILSRVFEGKVKA